MVRNEMTRSDNIIRKNRPGTVAVGAMAAEATIGVAGGWTTGEVIAIVETVPVRLAADLTEGCATVTEDAVTAVNGWGSQAFGWLNFCSKAIRATAWAGLSAARMEMQPAPRTTHKARILIFAKSSPFNRSGEHSQDRFNLWLG